MSNSAAYVQATTFVVFLLPFNLPGADIYPMFVRDDLARRDDAPLGDGLQRTTLSWPGQPAQRPVIQVSRRTRGGAFTVSNSSAEGREGPGMATEQVTGAAVELG